jgi:hypothetical protein
MEQVPEDGEDRFLSWHRSGEPLPLDRAVRDHARAAKPLQVGDSVLVRGTWEAIGRLQDLHEDLVVVGRPEEVVTQVTRLNARSALEASGGADQLADLLVATLGSFSPVAVLAGIFLVATTLSQVMSNTATEVLMSPIVLTAAAGLGVAPHPFTHPTQTTFHQNALCVPSRWSSLR